MTRKNNAQLLHEKYEQDLKDLQETCPHEQLSDWMSVMWAPGHLCNYDAQVCMECNKHIHIKHWCTGCGEELIDDVAVEAKDIHGSHPFGSFFCKKCIAKPYDFNKRVERKTLSAWEKQRQEWNKQIESESQDETK